MKHSAIVFKTEEVFLFLFRRLRLYFINLNLISSICVHYYILAERIAIDIYRDDKGNDLIRHFYFRKNLTDPSSRTHEA